MDHTLPDSSGEDERIVLNLLNSVDDGAQSQRRIAEELGIALGLVNAYLKRCIKKGLVKVSQAPARRYAYYLTPEGFAEKSRLTVESGALREVGLGRDCHAVGCRLRCLDRRNC